MEEKNLSLNEWHKKQAVESFNATWDLIDKKDRSIDDNIKMVHTAHASRYHWEVIGTALELARGEWQISRVYSLLNMAESALFHAHHSLKLCIDNNIGDFDLAFAYEAVTRAYFIGNNLDLMKKNYELAMVASKQISKPEDKEYFLTELNTIPL
ncbi:hypothetical protein F8154_07830 [Alkaliphilus pronyensis]|uniref:Uncharacterized protein n=1 Tax=Alkaliphilus pronyensis TaxID=1482732 RepID=A0A6I0F1C3_9FIRM|nr:hypothetical protein [Alkaliphilus pronyensis]KAB3534762.1 hypothetical protein F8154_07830 [Alkaliphilus pronyensis]